jgi:signal transduction histidine kinase
LAWPQRVESECHAFTDREGIVVALEVAPLPERIPNDLALCFYRILQEACATSPSTPRPTASPSRSRPGTGLLVLRVVDHGVGFDFSRRASSPVWGWPACASGRGCATRSST